MLSYRCVACAEEFRWTSGESSWASQPRQTLAPKVKQEGGPEGGRGTWGLCHEPDMEPARKCTVAVERARVRFGGYCTGREGGPAGGPEVNAEGEPSATSNLYQGACVYRSHARMYSERVYSGAIWPPTASTAGTLSPCHAREERWWRACRWRQRRTPPPSPPTPIAYGLDRSRKAQIEFE